MNYIHHIFINRRQEIVSKNNILKRVHNEIKVLKGLTRVDDPEQALIGDFILVLSMQNLIMNYM